MSVVEGFEEVEHPPRRTPTLCLMSMVVLGDAQHPGCLSCLNVECCSIRASEHMLSYAPAHASVMGMTSDHPVASTLYGSILGHFEATGCACRVEPTPPGGWD